MTHMNRLYNIFLYSHIRNPHVGWVDRLFAKPINQKQTHGNNALFDKRALY